MLTLLAAAAFAAPVVLTDKVLAWRAAVDGLTAETCAPVTEAFYADLRAIDPAEVDLVDARDRGPDMIRDLFATRAALQRQIAAFYDAKSLTPECIRGVRRADLAGRYLIDHYYEVLPAAERPDDWLVDPAFSFPSPARGVRSGDVLVTRAELLSSAGIAHIGRIDSQFSHNAMVWVAEDGTPWVVEAYMEYGAIVEPLSTFLASGLGRIVVMRYEDADLAAAAAGAAFERVARGRKIRYDDDLEWDDHKELFCSEVAPWAFSLVGGPTDLPYDLSRFEKAKNPAMYAAMGLEADVLSAPADLLFDPRFSLVAEWRDVPQLRKLRIHDAVVEGAMGWMEEKGYKLDVGFEEKAMIAFGKTLRNTPILGLAVRKKLSPTSDFDFLTASLALDSGANALLTEVYRALEYRDPAKGVLGYREIQEIVEQVRQDDLTRWQQDPAEAKFTGILHP